MDSHSHNFTPEILYAQQIVDIDWYLSKPLKDYDPSYCYLSNCSIKHVPILRIFGSTPSKQSACLHIHGIFPYLYMLLPPKVDPSLPWLRELSKDIDKGINRVLESNINASCHVYDIKIIAGKQFYGYHPDRDRFLQIFLYEPSHVHILANLLLTGEILDIPLQPHEAHIPFPLQFLIDYNLYGMSFIYLDKLQFRVTFALSDRNSSSSSSSPHNTAFSSRIWCPHLIEKEHVHSEPRHSSCQLEADTLYHAILNPSLFASSDNPGINMIWEDEKERRKVQGLTTDITLPQDLERHVELSISELLYMKKLEIIIQERKIQEDLIDKSFYNSNTCFNQKASKEPLAAFLLLSPPSLTLPGDENIVSILTELDLGTDKEEFRMLNLDGHIVTLPSNFFVDSQIYDPDAHDLSSHKTIDSNSEIINTSFQVSQIQSFNISLIRHSFITAASEYLPSEFQGFIFNSHSHLCPFYDLALLEDMMDETEALSQPLTFGLELLHSNSDIIPPLQLDGTGRRGRPRKKITDCSFKSGTASHSKMRTELKFKTRSKSDKTLLKHATTHYSQFSSLENIPLVVKISRSGLKLSDPEQIYFPFTKYPILEIPRIDLRDYSSSLGSELKFNKQDNLENMVVHEGSMEIFLPHNRHSFNPDKQNLSLGLNCTERNPNSIPNSDIFDEENETIMPVSFEFDEGEEISTIIQLSNISKDLNSSNLSHPPLSNNTTSYTNPYPVEKSRYLIDNASTEKPTIQPPNFSQTNESSFSLESENVSKPGVPNLLDANNDSNNMPIPVVRELEEFQNMDLVQPLCTKETANLYSIDEMAYTIRNIKGGSISTGINELELVSISPQATPRSSIISQKSSEEYVCLDGDNIDYIIPPNMSPTSSNINDKSEYIPMPQNLQSNPIDYFVDELSKISHIDSICSSSSEMSKPEQDPKSADILNPKSIDPSYQDIQMVGIDYKFSVSPISDNSVAIVTSPQSSLVSSSGSISSKSAICHAQLPILGFNPLKGLKEMKVSNNRPHSQYSSVSSESVPDNLEYEISDTLIEIQGGEVKQKNLNCLESNFYADENIDQVFAKENVHSTPLLQRSDSIVVISEDPFSPISKEDHQSNFMHPPLSNEFHSSYSSLQGQNMLTLLDDRSPSYQRIASLLQLESDQRNLENSVFPSQTISSIPHCLPFEGDTLVTSQNFKLTSQDLNYINTSESRVGEYLTIMSVEILIRTRDKLLPDPQYDSVLAICYDIYTYKCQCPIHIYGIISINDTWDMDDLKKIDCLALSSHNNVKMTHIVSEIELFQEFINTVLEYDPDICVGYEYQFLSWGYLIERASLLQIDLLFCLSRAQPPGKLPRRNLKEKPYNFNYSDPKIVGRILLNLWRICKHEVTLNNYTFENVAFHVLHRRFPLFSYDILTKWYTVFPSLHRWSSLQYYFDRAMANIQIIDALNIIGRTSELARLFGIEFYDVLSRGTQYRVESMMIRLLKRYEYIVVSPSVRQRAKMLPPSEIPLVMEPLGPYFTDPVVVLDFQSLYPSIIIAYNYCYSTCLGRLENLKREGNFLFGATKLNIPINILENLKPCDVTISPNGVVFVKPHIRRGMLPIMLDEILMTRIMVKQAMKKYKDLPLIQKRLNIRQIGLKLISNVTYGYTQANLSGRMPCVELGDSVVAKARETLEHAIQIVNSSSEWNARVIYGDTDSLFIHLPGCSRSEAFDLGFKITDFITKINPKPIKLKFEKVYQPCIFMSKKRYVGFSFESEKQTNPLFDAKGIETVRRDSCPIVSKLLERSLKQFFRTNDINEVRKLVIEKCSDLFSGSISIQDFIFAREFRGIHGYQPGIVTHSLHLARQKIRNDPRAEPRIGSRIPYLYVYDDHNLPLIDLVRTPEQVIVGSSLLIHLHYYLHHHIFPALGRAFDKVGANVDSWLQYIPRKYRPIHYDIINPIEKLSLSIFIDTNLCIVCGREKIIGLCQDCATDSQRKHSLIGNLFQDSIARLQDIRVVCKACHGDTKSKECESTDCHIYYKRMKLTQQLNYAKRLSDLYLCHSIDLAF